MAPSVPLPSRLGSMSQEQDPRTCSKKHLIYQHLLTSVFRCRDPANSIAKADTASRYCYPNKNITGTRLSQHLGYFRCECSNIALADFPYPMASRFSLCGTCFGLRSHRHLTAISVSPQGHRHRAVLRQPAAPLNYPLC